MLFGHGGRAVQLVNQGKADIMLYLLQAADSMSVTPDPSRKRSSVFDLPAMRESCSTKQQTKRRKLYCFLSMDRIFQYITACFTRYIYASPVCMLLAKPVTLDA